MRSEQEIFQRRCPGAAQRVPLLHRHQHRERYASPGHRLRSILDARTKQLAEPRLRLLDLPGSRHAGVDLVRIGRAAAAVNTSRRRVVRIWPRNRRRRRPASAMAFHHGRGSQEGLIGEARQHAQLDYLPARRLVVDQKLCNVRVSAQTTDRTCGIEWELGHKQILRHAQASPPHPSCRGIGSKPIKRESRVRAGWPTWWHDAGGAQRPSNSAMASNLRRGSRPG